MVKELKHQRILGGVAVGWGDGFAFRLVFAGERRSFFRAFCQRLFERVAAFVQGCVGLFVAIVGLDLGAYVGKRARLRFFAFADGEEQGALRPDFYGFADFVVGQGLGAKELCLYFRLVQPGGGVAVGGDGAQALGLAAGDAGDGRQAFAILCGVKGLVGVFGVGGFVFTGGKAAQFFVAAVAGFDVAQFGEDFAVFAVDEGRDVAWFGKRKQGFVQFGAGAFAFGGQGEFAAFACEGFVLDVLPVVGEGFAAVFDGGSSVAGGFGVVYDEVAAAAAFAGRARFGDLFVAHRQVGDVIDGVVDVYGFRGGVALTVRFVVFLQGAVIDVDGGSDWRTRDGVEGVAAFLRGALQVVLVERVVFAARGL